MNSLESVVGWAKIAALVFMAIKLSVLINERNSLQKSLDYIKIESAAIEQIYIAEKQKVQDEYRQNMASIADNYSAVIARLRSEAAGSDTKPPAPQGGKSEQGCRPDRMQAELLEWAANVARYADELRLVGGACERLAE